MASAPEFCERRRNSVNGPGLAGTADFAAAIVCHRGERPPVAGFAGSWLTGCKFFTDHSNGFACRVCIFIIPVFYVLVQGLQERRELFLMCEYYCPDA